MNYSCYNVLSGVFSPNFTSRKPENGGEHRPKEVRPLRKSRYSDKQIAAALRQAEAGAPIADITRKLGISEAIFYAWRQRFGVLGRLEIPEPRQLREDNARLKRLAADLTLDRRSCKGLIAELDREASAVAPLLHGASSVAKTLVQWGRLVALVGFECCGAPLADSVRY
jgi:putative transposase